MRQNPHVRICGGPGSATTLVYPTSLGRRAGAGSRTRDRVNRRPVTRAWRDESSPHPRQNLSSHQQLDTAASLLLD